MDKLKVVWICHFSNKEIRSKLSLSKRVGYPDYASWITNMIVGFEKRDDVELHVIAPHKGMNKYLSEFFYNGVYYYFYKSDAPIINKSWPNFFPIDYWTSFLISRIKVYTIVKKIKPDIISLIGAENPYYSSTILWLRKLKIPVYILIQGIYSNPVRFLTGLKPNKIRIRIERKIHTFYKYFGVGAPFFINLIKRDNKSATYLNVQAPRQININSEVDFVNKTFDFVFFARIVPNKGIEDLFESLSIVKKTFSDVSLNVIGPVNKNYLSFLKEKACKMNLEKNITFSGNFLSLDDVHYEVLKAKISVLPTKFEGMASNLIESMLLGLPVVTCRTGGLPYLNKDGETVLMSEPGDIKAFADNMLRFLKEPDFANDLSIKAKEFALKEFGIEKITNNLIMQYHAIINNFKNNKPIPDELLFDETLFIEK